MILIYTVLRDYDNGNTTLTPILLKDGRVIRRGLPCIVSADPPLLSSSMTLYHCERFGKIVNKLRGLHHQTRRAKPCNGLWIAY